MAKLEPMEDHMKFFYQIKELHKKLGILIRDFEATLPDSTIKQSGPMEITDPETGRAIEVKERR